MASQQEIYKGFWTNWIDGRVEGATLTLSRDGGAYLIAFLALFVHVSGASFWRMASFAIFYHRSKPDLDHDVILQQQTVFRNSASAISSLRGFFKIFVRSKDWKKSLPAVLWAFLNIAGFLAAGILSSRVTSTRSDVLLMPTDCGEWTRPEEMHQNMSNFVVEEAIRVASLAKLKSVSQEYAAVCYNPENSPEGCSTFGRRTPQWTKEIRSGCPFSDDICLVNTTFSVDSGSCILDTPEACNPYSERLANSLIPKINSFIASDLNLGINSRPADRVSLRTRVECAPLKQDGYVKTYHGKEALKLFLNNSWYGSAKEDALASFDDAVDHQWYDAYFYGPSLNPGKPNVQELAATYIFNYGTFAQNVGGPNHVDVYLATPSFELWPDGPLVHDSDFDPIPALRIPEQQVTLMFLSTNALSSALITDPWFRMDKPCPIKFHFSDGESYNYTLYERDPATTILGGSLVALNAVISRISGILLPRSARNAFRESSWDANELLELRAEAFGEKMSQIDSRSIISEKTDEHNGRASSGSE